MRGMRGCRRSRGRLGTPRGWLPAFPRKAHAAGSLDRVGGGVRAAHSQHSVPEPFASSSKDSLPHFLRRQLNLLTFPRTQA